ncbi:MAG: radical SAM protein, partial [Alistipes sp.]|nr:radical SAM protein [Alistipes sp.]
MSNHSLSLRRRLALEAWRRIKNERRKEHRLTQLMWECTLRCNLKCRHCGSDCHTDALKADMPLKDFLKVLESIKANTNPNKVFIVITGGEPLMRTDLEQCGRAIYEIGFPWGMVTNGMAMTEKRFHSLLAAGMHTATVSLDGIGEEHNNMRGHARSFDNAVEAIRLMGAQPDFVFDVVTCVNRRNIKQLDQIKELLISLGVKQWRLFTIFPVGRAASDEMLQLTKEEYRQLLDYIKQNRQQEERISLSYACEGFLGNYEGEVRKTFYTCNAGINVASV